MGKLWSNWIRPATINFYVTRDETTRVRNCAVKKKNYDSKGTSEKVNAE